MNLFEIIVRKIEDDGISVIIEPDRGYYDACYAPLLNQIRISDCKFLNDNYHFKCVAAIHEYGHAVSPIWKNKDKHLEILNKFLDNSRQLNVYFQGKKVDCIPWSLTLEECDEIYEEERRATHNGYKALGLNDAEIEDAIAKVDKLNLAGYKDRLILYGNSKWLPFEERERAKQVERFQQNSNFFRVRFF